MQTQEQLKQEYIRGIEEKKVLEVSIKDKEGNPKTRKCVPLDCGEKPEDHLNGGYSIYYISIDSPNGRHSKKTFLSAVESISVIDELFNPKDYKEFEYKDGENWHFSRNW